MLSPHFFFIAKVYFLSPSSFSLAFQFVIYYFCSITMSSGMSLGAVSDHMRSRTPDDSATQSSGADRFLAESLDDEMRDVPPSPPSSTVDSRVAASELRHRDSTSQRDIVRASSTRTELVIPRLMDKEIGEAKPNELRLVD